MIEELRIAEWIDKVILVCISCILAVEKFDILSLYYLGLALTFTIILLQYGFLINSYCDNDRKIFKPKITRLVLFFLGLAIVFLLLITRQPIPISIGLITFFLATYYSAPPLRFKKRAWLGLSAVFAQYVLPFVFFISLMAVKTDIAIVLAVYLTILGTIKLIIHQVDDYHTDKDKKINTIVVLSGKKKGLQMCYVLLAALMIVYLSLFLIFSILYAAFIFFLLFIGSIPSFLYIRKVIKAR